MAHVSYVMFSCDLSCLSSSHIQLLFSDRDNSLSMSEVEKHPVVLRLKETYQLGARNSDIRYLKIIFVTRKPIFLPGWPLWLSLSSGLIFHCLHVFTGCKNLQ